MTEAGGPTAQAGIYYQNSVAALYLGRLIDPSKRSVRERVISVRIEAPAHVDDVVVRYADGTSHFIQAKSALRMGDDVWRSLWRSFVQQRRSMAEDDRLILVLGQPTDLATDLKECSGRATALNLKEWHERLTVSQARIARDVEAVSGLAQDDVLNLFKHMDVLIYPAQFLERELPSLWMPPASAPANPLHAVLRDLAGGGARRRDIFYAPRVRAHLLETHGIEIPEPASWGAERYRMAIESELRIEVPGTSIARPIAEGFIWPETAKPSTDRTPDLDDEIGQWRLGTPADHVDLSKFPSPQLTRLVIVAGPGLGKSTLMLALASRALAAKRLPARITVAELSDADLEIGEFLEQRLNRTYGTTIDWTRAAESGLLVLLIDGLDEVSSERRVVLLTRLKRFCGLHSAVDWVLTVRDASALAAPQGAQTLELVPLSDEAIRRFVLAYRPNVPDVLKRLTALLDSRPEVRRLTRIPLFLSMLLATMDRTGSAPRDRAEIIENYLALLCDPARFKLTERIVTEPSLLREIAERVAFDALERDEIGLPQRALGRLVRELATRDSPHVVIEDLVKCGILRRPEPSRYEFPFPIVQEYLAGCFMLDHKPDEIPWRLHSLPKRPWAQAIQFALERHPDSSAIVDALLDEPDDAFSSHLRLIGRCVTNGMIVSPEHREIITKRLVAIWDPNAFWLSRSVGSIIADAFHTPLIAELRARLFQQRFLPCGSGRILAQLADTKLSLDVLRSWLKESSASLLNLHDFQEEIDRIGDKAFRLYVEAARMKSDAPESVRGIAALIDHLSPANVDQGDLAGAITDETLPPFIRAAAVTLLEPLASPASIEPLLERVLAIESWITPDVVARAAIRHGICAKVLVRWATAPTVSAGNGPEFLGQAILKCSTTRRSALLDDLLSQLSLAGTVRSHALVYMTSLGRRDAFRELVNGFAELPVAVVARTCSLLGHFPTIEAAQRVKSALIKRDWDADGRRSISSSLVTGLMGRLQMLSFSTGFIEATAIHPGREILFPLLDDWARHDDYEPCEALRMCVDLVRLGHRAALPDLRPRLASALAEGPSTSSRDEHYRDHEIGRCIDVLMENGDPLSLAELEAIVRSRSHNCRSTALRAIARLGTMQACDSLIALYPLFKDGSTRDGILTPLQTLASQLGVRIRVEGDALTLTST